MLVQFSVKNYKTFESEAKISFVASKYYAERVEDNVVDFPKFDLKLLKSAVIYGANASGKSKLFDSMDFAKRFILSSANDHQINEPIQVDSFRLNSATIKAPSVFEIIFIHKNEMYRYGFEVTTQKVVTEWLYHRPNSKEIELFFRDEQKFEIHPTKFKVKDLIDNNRIRPNALMLSAAASWNDKIASTVLSWVKDNFNIISGLKEQNYIGYSIGKLKENKTKNEILRLIKNADLGIDDLTPQILEADSLPKELPKELKEILEKKMKEDGAEFASDVITSHKKFNATKEDSESTTFSMDDDESSGTKKYFALSGPILETLKNGEVLVIDELDAKLHPNLTHKIIELFNSKTKNPLNAQLLFNTHDTNLLDLNLFRRDQIWFTEKDRYGAASLYSLSDIKGVRKEDPLEKNYISGKYGAIPFLGDFDKLFND
jgi:AAA15 family ATPase/GTPase